ncbi:ribonuclease T2 family protein [Paenochrobactrum pullorum]|uniref:ribonuclease T2 family protein n=1 Tax=Paenochrobactrum pullorum TaxID=1324351 RepID=UPI0035BC6660
MFSRFKQVKSCPWHLKTALQSGLLLIGTAVFSSTVAQAQEPVLKPDWSLVRPKAQNDNHRLPAPSSQQGFDFYVLSLSWSPSFCTLDGRGNDSDQCNINRRDGFLVHGLWPQNETGYPQNCAIGGNAKQRNYVPRQIANELKDIMPSAGLIRHQWRKHGTCSGLNQQDYFSTLRQAFDKIVIPPSLKNLSSTRRVDPSLIEKAFIAANPAMKENGISVTCKKNYLQEVRICMTKDLQLRPCAAVDRAACRSRSVTLPATR